MSRRIPRDEVWQIIRARVKRLKRQLRAKGLKMECYKCNQSYLEVTVHGLEHDWHPECAPNERHLWDEVLAGRREL